MKKVSALTLVLVMFISLAACGGNNGQSSAPSPSSSGGAPIEAAPPPAEANYKEEVIIALKAQVSTLDPQALVNTVQTQVLKLWHGTLVDRNDITGEIKPDLAESWSMIDETTVEFKIHPDARFHNGEPVTAQDVVFTMERGKDGVGSSAHMAIMESVTAIDGRTVQIKTATPNMDILDLLTLPVYSILSEKAITENPEEGIKIGAGAWMLDEYVVNDYLAFTRFDDYHLGAGPTQKLRVRYIPEDSARVIAVQTGEIDLCTDLTPIDLNAVESDPNIKLIQYESPTCQYFAFNYSREPGNNKLLRQAVAHAINRDDIIAGVESGYAVPGKTFWGINQYGYYDGFEGYDYDVEKAAQMVIDAGYPDGLDLQVSVISGKRVTTAEILQAQLKPIGINIIINEVDSAAMTAITTEGRHEACLFGIGFNSTGDEARRVYHTNGSNNRSMFSNERVDELIDLAVAEMDESKRLAYYREIQEIANEEIPVICLYYEAGFCAAANGLDGIDWGTNASNDMSGVYVLLD